MVFENLMIQNDRRCRCAAILSNKRPIRFRIINFDARQIGANWVEGDQTDRVDDQHSIVKTEISRKKKIQLKSVTFVG